MTNEQLKRCSALLAIKEMQIKISVRYPFTPKVMTRSKESASVHWVVEKSEPSSIAGANVKLHSHFGKQSSSFK